MMLDRDFRSRASQTSPFQGWSLGTRTNSEFMDSPCRVPLDFNREFHDGCDYRKPHYAVMLHTVAIRIAASGRRIELGATGRGINHENPY